MSTKVAIAVVILVVVLFAAAVALSGRRGEGDVRLERDDATDDGEQDDGDDGFPSNLSDRLDGAGSVARGDVDADECVDPNDDLLLVFDSSCNLVVSGSDERLRLLRMETQGAVTVVAPAPEGEDDDDDGENDNYEIEAAYEPGARITLAIGRDTTDVVLDCEELDPCVVRLVLDG